MNFKMFFYGFDRQIVSLLMNKNTLPERTNIYRNENILDFF